MHEYFKAHNSARFRIRSYRRNWRRSLIDVGELGVAFENLCTQLYEYDVMVDAETKSSLAAIGGYLGLDLRLWERLDG